MADFIPDLVHLVDLIGTQNASQLLQVSPSSIRDWTSERRYCHNPAVHQRLAAVKVVNDVLEREMSPSELASWWFASKNGSGSPADSLMVEAEVEEHQEVS